MYDIKQIEDCFWVFEVKTQQYIKNYTCREDASRLKKKLNLGYGFSGFTPDFFNTKYKVSVAD